MNVPRGWYVKSIRYEGKEIIDEATEFKDSSDPSVLQVMLSNRGAVVTGAVVNEGGKPVDRALVVMFRASGVPSDARLISSTRASSTGIYRIGPARPGDYLIVALPPAASTPQPWGDWDRVARLATIADRITLGDFDERTVELRVVNKQ